MSKGHVLSARLSPTHYELHTQTVATTTMQLQNRFGAAPGEEIPGEEVMFWIIRPVRD